jgi:hypothetical protein
MVAGNSIGGFFIVLTLGDLVRPMDFKPPITITITITTIQTEHAISATVLLLAYHTFTLSIGIALYTQRKIFPFSRSEIHLLWHAKKILSYFETLLSNAFSFCLA